MNISPGSMVALDTQILIWGGLRRMISGVHVAKPEDVDKERRARMLFHDLNELKVKLVIPAVAVAELLCPIPHEDHAKFLAVVSSRFDCPPFDIRSTALAARLWKQGRDLPPDEQVKRSVLKADMQIIASAHNRGVRYFFSDDLKCRKLALMTGICALPLPTHSLNLFIEQEMEDDDEPPFSQSARHGS